MSKSSDFPVVFTIGGSSRHEIVFINPGFTIDDISKKVEGLASTSVNCQEPLAKYKKKGEPEKVSSIKVRWATEGRDTRLYPKHTVLTEDNCEAVLTLVGQSGGKDVLDVDMQGAPPTEEEAGEK
ncbi:hypothetical protein AAFC00_000134 [Neodothiora populina]|uniref:Uncharacterized protein n=1 Tax=Neodothiora populina TaxID=2781224 RepID=A0ABR3P1H9_9PEZI